MNKPVREGFVEDEPVDADEAVARPEPARPAPPPSPSELLDNEWPITVRLMHKPVTVIRPGGVREEISELVFREPTGADINRLGNPVRVDLLGDVHVDDRRMMEMMTALSGVMTPQLARMDTRDYCSCAYRLRIFFLPNPRAWVKETEEI